MLDHSRADDTVLGPVLSISCFLPWWEAEGHLFYPLVGSFLLLVVVLPRRLLLPVALIAKGLDTFAQVQEEADCLLFTLLSVRSPFLLLDRQVHRFALIGDQLILSFADIVPAVLMLDHRYEAAITS